MSLQGTKIDRGRKDHGIDMDYPLDFCYIVIVDGH